MGKPDEDQLSPVFSAIRQHEAGAQERLFELAYGELRRMAHGQMIREAPGHTLQTTGLANEAYFKLCRGDAVSWENRRHFFGAAARAMRCILIDHARQKIARGGQHAHVTLEDDDALTEPSFDVIALDAAMDRLAKSRPRAAMVVGYRFYLGMTVPETAELLAVSARTVNNDWELAKAWLKREMDPSSEERS